MDQRKLFKKKINKKSKETTYTSTQEASFHSYTKSNGSLLIHEDSYEIFSDEDVQFQDKDIPLEKRHLLNDANYFKQLSLSFYGLPNRSVPKPAVQEDFGFHCKTEASTRIENRSLSPSAGKEYLQILRKSPNVPYESDGKHGSLNNLFKLVHANQPGTTSYLGAVIRQRGNEAQKLMQRDSNNNSNVSRGNISAYRSIPSRPSTNTQRIAPLGIYPPLTSGFVSAGLTSANSPKNSQAAKENASQKSFRPSFKKVLAKSKVLVSEYLQTEPNSTEIRHKNSKLIPSKLKMYAQENLASLNLKELIINQAKFQSQSRLQSHRPKNQQENLFSIRPSVLNSSSQNIKTKRVVVIPTKPKAKNVYYS